MRIFHLGPLFDESKETNHEHNFCPCTRLMLDSCGTERAGLLEWLSGDLKTFMGSLLFGGLGIVRIVHDSTEENSDKIQTIHVEMYCETITPNFL